MSIPHELVVKYKLREVSLSGSLKRIVLHGKFGSSALVALSNAVLQSYDVGWALNTEGGMRGRPKYVRVEALQEMIELAVVIRLQESMSQNTINGEQMLTMWAWCKESISELHKCSNINPVFESCNTFAERTEFEVLCDFLGLVLCHGLLVDPKDDPEIVKAVDNKSYYDVATMLPNEIEKNAGLKKFLRNIRNGVTAAGLKQLNEVIKEKQIAVLFKDNHFSCVGKLNEHVVELVSVEEEARRTPKMIWMVLKLEKVDKGKQPTRVHDDMPTLQKQQLIIEAEAQQPKKSKISSKKRRQLKRRIAANSQSDVQQHLVVSNEKAEDLKGSKSSEEETDQEVEREETQEEKDGHTCEAVKHFLRMFTEEGASAPFFDGQVKAMSYCNSYKVSIKFEDLVNHDKETARYVCDNLPRIQDALNQCVCNILLEYDEFKMKLDEVLKKTRIEIYNLPAPYSVRSFKAFASEHDMHRIWKLHDYGGKRVSATMYHGRQAGLGYLRFILKNHKAGHCWNGSFTLEDFVVLDHNGVLEFIIMKEASEAYSKEKALGDFNIFCIMLFRYFEADEADKKCKYPVYFNQFQTDYLICMPERKDAEAYDRWHKYMEDHFAFKAPQAITTLVTETYMVCDSARIGDQYSGLDVRGIDIKNWTDDIRNSGSISLVDTFDHGLLNPTENRYDAHTYWSMLVFGRHFSCHMLRAKRNQGVIMNVQDLMVVQLMLGFALKGRLACVIRHHMMESGYLGGLVFDEGSNEGNLDMSGLLKAEAKEQMTQGAEVMKQLALACHKQARHGPSSG